MNKLLMLISFNLFVLLGLGALMYFTDYIAYALTVDLTFIVEIISGTVLLSFIYSIFSMRKLMNYELEIKEFKGMSSPILPRTIDAMGSTYSEISKIVTTLGLGGTIIGFLVALGGVDPSAISDVDKMVEMVVVVIAGTKIALITTLVGAGAFLWNSINAMILGTYATQVLDLNTVELAKNV